MSNEVINPYQEFKDSLGVVLANGTITFNVNKGTTKETIYSDEDLTVAQSNPYTLDAYGRITGDVKYTGVKTLVIKTAAGGAVRTLDDVATNRSLSNLDAATTTALKAITGQVDNDHIYVLGHTTEGDEGGGNFFFDSSSSATDDDMITFQPDSGSGRWIRIFDTEVRPEMAGATRDGSTDDTTALQTSLTYAEDNKYTWALSNGEYDFSTVLVALDRITIRGQNKEDTKLVWVGGATIAMHIKALFAGGDDSEECWLGHFSIINEGTGTIGLQIDPSYTTLDHVRVYNSSSNVAFSTAHIQTDTAVNVNQFKCLNLEVRSDSNPGGAIGMHYARGANSLIQGGTFSTFEICLKVGNFTATGSDEVSDIDIMGGVLFELQGPHVTDNGIGLHVDGASGIRIAGRFDFGNGSRPGQLAILFTNRLRGCVVSGSDIAGNGAATSAIQFGDTTSISSYEDANSVLIEGNSFLQVGSVSTYIIIFDGEGKAITAATQANPVVITSASHPHTNGDEITILSVSGMTELNNRNFIVANTSANTYELTGIDGTGFTAYTSGGSSTRYDNPNITIGTNSMSSTGGNFPLINPAFRDQDATPSVARGNFFKTANTVATTITNFDGVDRVMEKEIMVLINDANTTIDFSSSSLKGNNGVDLTGASGDFLRCRHHDNIWYCTVELG